jgi:hypothetical protein
MINGYRYFGGAHCWHVGVHAVQVIFCSNNCIYQLTRGCESSVLLLYQMTYEYFFTVLEVSWVCSPWYCNLKWTNCTGSWWNDNWPGKTKVRRVEPFPVPLYKLQIPCRLTWDRTIASVMIKPWCKLSYGWGISSWGWKDVIKCCLIFVN